MAMGKPEDTGMGFFAPKAYHRVGRLAGDADNPTVIIHSYVDKATFQNGGAPYKERVFKLKTVDKANFMSDVYAKVKASERHGGFFSNALEE